MSKKRKIEFETNLKQVEKDVKGLNKEIKNTESSLEGVTEVADGMTGGMITRFKSLIGTLRGVAMGFRTVGAAIAATGIGLLVVAVGSLVSAFTRSAEGQAKFAKLMGVIGAVTDEFLDVLSRLGEKLIWAFENPREALNQLGEAIKNNIMTRLEGMLMLLPRLGEAISLVFRGEFSEAGKVAVNAIGEAALGVEDLTGKIQGAGEAIKEFGKEVAEDAKSAAKIADMREKARQKENQLIKDQAKLQSQINEERLKAEDRENLSTEERIAAVEKAAAMEQELLNRQIEINELKRDAIILENTLADSSAEAERAEAEAIAAVDQSRADSLNRQRELVGKRQALINEAAAEEKRIADEKAKAEADAIKEKERLEEDARKKKAAADKAAADEEARLAKERVEAEKAAQKAKVDITKAGFDLLINIAGKDSKIGKSLAVAQATISAFQGAQNAFTTAAASPITAVFPAYPAIQAAAAAAFGAVQVAKIKSTDPTGGGGGSISTPSAATISPNVSIAASANPANQIADALNNSEPQKAYVVSGDVSSAQELDRKIDLSASF